MKKLFILFGLLILSSFIQEQRQAQKYKEFVLQADLFKQRERQDTTIEFPHWGKSRKDSTLITIRADSLVMIANEEKDSYKLIEILDRAEGIDLIDGDKWDGIMWVATDNSGVQVKLIVMKYVSGTVLITITYGNVEYRYQCRLFKKPYQRII